MPLLTESNKRTMGRVTTLSSVPLSLLVVGLLALLLRWVFGNDRRAVPEYDGDDFGLLNAVAVVPTPEAADVLAECLRGEGIKATVVHRPDGSHRVMVFPSDVPNARLVLRG